MRFLLLNGLDDGFLKRFLDETLKPLGTLNAVSASHGVPPGEEPDGLIIVDATAVERPEVMVKQLRAERWERRIVVLTASPSWGRARAAFEAGAMDYLSKSLTMAEMREAFQQALSKPWPR